MEANASGKHSNERKLLPVGLRREDPGKRESGFFFLAETQTMRVVYSRNLERPGCLENELLDTCDSSHDKLDRIKRKIEPYVQSLDNVYWPATGIHLATAENKLTFKVFQDLEVLPGLSDLPEVPSSLSDIPIAMIANLLKLDKIAYEVDLVSWSGDQYAFKKTTCAKSMLTELEALHRLRGCTAINPPSALVVDASRRLRGFLSRYMPGGDLGTLLEERNKMREAGTPVSVIPWLRKLAWASTLARALFSMHSAGICNGDLKPDNVLLDGYGNIRLVDFGPVGPTGGWGAPEYSAAWDAFDARVGNAEDSDNQDVVTDGNLGNSRLDSDGFNFADTLTPAMDVYGLGAIMWALGEEKTCGLETRTWELSPPWYRAIVEQCLAEDPAHRPTATNILLRLLARRFLLLMAP
ncbi:kinase-like domain-containing protein [Phellopilus nigrolimitatus]|nr:kinase-like domain-containing protein [Phellopilus nigrolimitatus]